MQERHVLEWWRASFSSKLGLSMKREGHDNWNILTIPIEMVSVLLIQRVRSISHEGAFFFSQKNTEEQNTQRFTETLSQPISQNLTANLSWKASVFSVCRRRSVGSKCAPKGSVNSVRSVREKTSPQRVSSVFFSQIYTEKQNTQHSTETLSQQIAQNLTATFSYNVLWYLYAGGVLWVRNSAQKGSVRSVSSVREKPPQRFSSVLSLTVGAFYFSQMNTDEQISQRGTETLSQPISQNVTANVN